jgi:chemotaxis protein CheX
MAASPTFAIVSLPAILDLKEAKILADQLSTVRGRPLKLDASRVERLGGLCLQVLLSARNTWAAENLPIAVVDSSPAFTDALATFGASSFTT